MKQALLHLGNAGFQVSADKRKFFSKLLKFLGFVWTPAIPTNIKVVRHLLGVWNFIKNHIQGRAALMEPKTRFTKKDLKLKWGEEQETAIKLIKEKFAEAIKPCLF